MPSSMLTEGEPSTRTSWPRVERDIEPSSVLARLRPGGSRGVVVTGGPGVGKSSLVQGALGLATAAGWLAFQATATKAAASVPFGPLAHLLPAADGEPTSPLAVMRDAGRALIEQADGRPVLLAVDDAHLLDLESAALVHQLVTTGACSVLLAVRTGEASPGPLLALWKDGHCPLLTLEPLSVDQVHDLLGHAVGGHVAAATVYRLAHLTGGNLFYLRELVATGLASGALTAVDGAWEWRGPVTPAGGLLELLSDHLRRLSAAEREVLEVVAVAEPIEADILTAVVPAASLAAAEGAGLVDVVSDDGRTTVRLADPLHGEVLRTTTSPLQGRLVRQRLAEAVEKRGARRGNDALRLAVWRLEAGQEVGTDSLVSGARHALAVGDHLRAEELARAAVRAGEAFWGPFLLSRALVGQGRVVDADRLLASLYAEALTGRQRVDLATNRASILFRHLGRAADAEDLLLAAEASAEEASEKEELASTRALLLLHNGRPADASRLAASIVDGRQPAGLAAVQANAVRAAATALSGRPVAALACIDAVAPAAASVGPVLVSSLLAIRWDALWFAGHLDEADDLARREQAQALEAANAHARATATFQLGLSARMRGRVETAVALLREAMVVFAGCDPSALARAGAALAQALAMRGDAAAAERALADAVARQGGRASDGLRITTASAWVKAVGGDLAGARSLTRRSAGMARACDMAALEIFAWHDCARLGDTADGSARLAELAGHVDGDLLPAMIDHVAALDAGDASALDAIAGRFERMGILLFAAEASAAAADAHRRAGRDRRALRAGRDAVGLAGRCENVQSSRLVGVEPLPALTRRELEVAMLAAGGLTNQAIAARLTVSIRTVDNLLHRAYQKLGITGRKELAGCLSVPRSDAP